MKQTWRIFKPLLSPVTLDRDTFRTETFAQQLPVVNQPTLTQPGFNNRPLFAIVYITGSGLSSTVLCPALFGTDWLELRLPFPRPCTFCRKVTRPLKLLNPGHVFSNCLIWFLSSWVGLDAHTSENHVPSRQKKLNKESLLIVKCWWCGESGDVDIPKLDWRLAIDTVYTIYPDIPPKKD